jgi:hypothetical protein
MRPVVVYSMYTMYALQLSVRAYHHILKLSRTSPTWRERRA